MEGIYNRRRHLGTMREPRECKGPGRKVQKRVQRRVKIGKKRKL